MLLLPAVEAPARRSAPTELAATPRGHETILVADDDELVLSMVDEGLVAVAFDANDHLPQLLALARRYADRQPDLADLCLVRMSELHPRHSVITVDRDDFRVYRRNKREIIPLICPPEE